jgi:hypothetical protein
VLLPLLYIFGLVFSLNSHYRLIEEEENLIHEANEMETEKELNLPARVEVSHTIGIHGNFFDIDRTKGEIVKDEVEKLGHDAGDDTSEGGSHTKILVVCRL